MLDSHTKLSGNTVNETYSLAEANLKVVFRSE